MPIALNHLKLASQLSHVERYINKPMVGLKQRVDQHSYLAALIYDYLGGKELLAALLHDAEEAVTGDIPSPIKKTLRGYEKYQALVPAFKEKKEKALFKVADELECLLYVVKQRKMGNALLVEMESDLIKSIQERAAKMKVTDKVYQIYTELTGETYWYGG